MFSFHVKRAVKIKLFHVKHRLFLRFSPLYIPLLFRFYLFYIHIILLRYVDFSRYLFVVFMGIFALNHVLFYGVLPCIFIASFECISHCLAQNQVRFIGLCHPATEFFALKSVFYCGSLFSNMATKEICWLVGWLVNSVCLALIVSDKLWLADRSLSCLFLIKCYHQAAFRAALRAFVTLSKHAFFGDF